MFIFFAVPNIPEILLVGTMYITHLYAMKAYTCQYHALDELAITIARIFRHIDLLTNFQDFEVYSTCF